MNVREERNDIKPGSQSMIRVFVCEAPMGEGWWSRSKHVNKDVRCERPWDVEDHSVLQISTVEKTG